MELDKDALKESLTEEDVTKIMGLLGSQPPLPSGDDLIYETICHHHPSSDKKFKLYYYKNTQLFKCYTHCDSAFDIFGLVQKAMQNRGYPDFTFEEAIGYVGDTVGYKNTSFIIPNTATAIDDWGIFDRYMKIDSKGDTHEELPEYSSNFLHVPSKLYFINWLREGIAKETMDKYDIGYYICGDRISIPHYDQEGRLIGMRGRALLKRDVDEGRKYMPLNIQNVLLSHPTSFALYGLTQNYDEIIRTKRLLIVEGEKSVLLLDSYYGVFSYCVAISGSSITERQIEIIRSLGIEEITIAMDKEFKEEDDEEKQTNLNKLTKLGQKFAPYYKTYVLFDNKNLLDYKDSPTDKGKEIFEELMKDRIEISSFSTR